jgi:hypothetical protein
VGLVDGYKVGTSVGDSDGSELGFMDGNTDGISDGLVDGNDDGLIVGNDDGLILGDIDGDILGRADGEIDGCDVGNDDGDTLGAADGASITNTDDTTNLSFVVFVTASRMSFDVNFFVSSRIVTVDSTNASTLRFSRRRSTLVHDTSLSIVTATSTDTPSCFSAAIKSEVMDSSTSVLLKGHLTTKSDFAKVCTTPTMEFDGAELGGEEGTNDGNELGALVGRILGMDDGDGEGTELGLSLGLTLVTSDGDVVGSLDGLFDGLAEGFTEGDADGKELGFTGSVGLGVSGGPLNPPPQAQLNGIDTNSIKALMRGVRISY